MAEVCLVGSTVAIVGGSEDKNIVTTAERISVVLDWTKKNIRVMARGLVGGRTIKVPVGELAQVSDLFRERPAFTTKFAMATNPNVFVTPVDPNKK